MTPYPREYLMIVDDVDLGTLDASDLTRARTCARALADAARNLGELAIGRVAASLLASLDTEARARAVGLPRGSVRVTLDTFADDDPDAAERSRARAVPYLQLVRDDAGERDAVRELFADLMAALEDPSPTARQVELARLEALS